MNTSAKTSYTFSHRLKGETQLELFENFYLRIKEKKLRRKREYKLEVAILNPQPLQVQENAFHWLAASIVTGLFAPYFLYRLLSAPNFDNLWTLLSAVAAAVLLSGIFALLYGFTAERKWVFETRSAHYPLVTLPYHKKDKALAQQFVQALQTAIDKNIAAKGYSNDVLFAGEMRMLRRLAKNQILSINTYDQAKKHMLEKGDHMGVAS